MHEMEYNTAREEIELLEYGRHVQRIVERCITIEDPVRRNQMAREIIELMGQLNPSLRNVEDFRHKLWDHLFIMSDFRLEVDSPYPIPSRESLSTKPSKLQYPSSLIKYRHYGKIVEKLIDNARNIEEPELKGSMVSAIAHHLKKSYLAWNRDSVADDIIFKDLKELSAGTLEMPEGTQLGAATEVLTANYSQGQGKKFNRNKQKQKPFKRKFGSSNSY
jgi:hypothetical protein